MLNVKQESKLKIRESEFEGSVFPFPNEQEDWIPSFAHCHIPRPNHALDSLRNTVGSVPHGVPAISWSVCTSAPALPSDKTQKSVKPFLCVIFHQIFEKSLNFSPVFVQNNDKSS